MEELKKHKDLYKCRTPPWKEVYREKCMDRLRENRAKHHSLRRNLNQNDSVTSNVIASSSQNSAEEGIESSDDRPEDIEDIMRTEWETMQEGLTGMDPGGDASSDNMSIPGSSINELVTLFEAIQEELKLEEQRLLAYQENCDGHLCREEEELSHALKALSTNHVICPLCEKNNLFEHKGIIVCKCGLRINTEQDCISLTNFSDNLEAASSEHSTSCEAKPLFSFTQNYGISNLIMSCEKCDFLFIVV